MTQTGSFSYTAKCGDTWDSVAFYAYQEERMAHHIIDQNRQYIDVVVFEGGERLRVPILDKAETPNSLPPWRR